MKYIVIPLLKLIVYTLTAIMWTIINTVHFIWHLKPHSNALIYFKWVYYWYMNAIPKNKSGNIYCISRYKQNVIPTDLIVYWIWLFKYGFSNQEIVELSKNEKRKCEEHIKSITYEQHTKES